MFYIFFTKNTIRSKHFCIFCVNVKVFVVIYFLDLKLCKPFLHKQTETKQNKTKQNKTNRNKTKALESKGKLEETIFW